MRTVTHVFYACVCILLFISDTASARPVKKAVLAESRTEVGIVGDQHGTETLPRTALEDTIWIADWTFEAGGACTDAGWEKIDMRIDKVDDQIYWSVKAGFDGQGGIVGEAAACGNHSLCCEDVDGYDNNWYQAIRIPYSGSGFLSFDYLLDSEPPGQSSFFDFLSVELDSSCASFFLADQNEDGLLDDPTIFSFPASESRRFRTIVFEDGGGLNLAGRVDSIAVTDFGSDDTHCLYIAFISDFAVSPCHGSIDFGLPPHPSTLGAALIIDNLQLDGVDVPLSEDFEATLDPRISFVDLQDDVGVGEWARVFEHVTDNDVCTENKTCAWLFTDDTLIANDPSMDFGPGAFVVRNWLDDSIVSPWVSLAETQNLVGTVLSWREFGGNSLSTSRIIRQWAVRGKQKVDNTDSATPGDSVDCVSPWGNANNWARIDGFRWGNRITSMESKFDLQSTEIQIRFRVADAQRVFGFPPPSPHIPGPGPYIDRVRIGRRLLTGPQALAGFPQDAFPTEINPFVTPAGEHHRPLPASSELKPGGGGRFGTAAFSRSGDLAQGSSPNLVTGDSITIVVQDLRGAGGIVSVEWYGAIVNGPHAGKAPPPWTVGANGFFVVPADSVRNGDGSVVENRWFVDLDDDYFRGGDVLLYFWLAEDAQGGVGSDPVGLSGVPASVEEAEILTRGLLEVSFLPTIDWDPAYLARVAADPNGKLEPTVEELANSEQAHCILYYEFGSNGRSGDIRRDSIEYTLDRLGYRDGYDNYDMTNVGSVNNANNQLGGRATVQQATGYALIIQAGGDILNPPLSDGTDLNNEKIDQVSWYRDWLETAATSEVGTATLWLINPKLVGFTPDNELLTSNMGVVLVTDDIGTQLGVNPEVDGQTAFTFENGNSVDFTSDLFTQDTGCPGFPTQNGLDASGTAVVTHRWKASSSGALGDGAVVMNSDPAQSWNTIMMALWWSLMSDVGGGSHFPPPAPVSPTPEEVLMSKILAGVLPQGCEAGDPTTDVREPDDEMSNLPKRTALYQNIPNPFNPTTTIQFDLAREGHVSLRIYDVAGRLIRTLVEQKTMPGRYPTIWDGLNDAGQRVPSGVYLYQLVTADHSATRKLVVMK